MLKKTVQYTDFDGNERTEELYFNLTQTELVEMAMELPDGITDSVGSDPAKIDENAAAVKLMEALGNKGVLSFIKNLLLKSYGIKSEDGRRFEKSEKISTEFSQTLAFDTILMDLMSNDVEAANFVNNVIPSKLVDKINNGKNNTPALPVK